MKPARKLKLENEIIDLIHEYGMQNILESLVDIVTEHKQDNGEQYILRLLENLQQTLVQYNTRYSSS